MLCACILILLKIKRKIAVVLCINEFVYRFLNWLSYLEESLEHIRLRLCIFIRRGWLYSYVRVAVF